MLDIRLNDIIEIFGCKYQVTAVYNTVVTFALADSEHKSLPYRQISRTIVEQQLLDGRMVLHTRPLYSLRLVKGAILTGSNRLGRILRAGAKRVSILWNYDTGLQATQAISRHNIERYIEEGLITFAE
jgi:hypothetical protein